MAKITRSDARTKAFEIIFSCLGDNENADEQIALAIEEESAYGKHFGYISTAVKGVADKNDEIMQLISENLAQGWSVERLSKINHAILLLAVYEMLYIDDVPPKVAINEAVELSKKYGDDNEPAFINGVLGSIMRKNAK